MFIRGFVGVAFGALSGFLIYMAWAMLALVGKPSGASIFLTFAGGGALSAWLVINGTRSVPHVLRRGFLLGAAEWLAMIPAGAIFAARFTARSASNVPQDQWHDSAVSGTALGAGLFSFLSSGFAFGMAVLCLACFAVTYFISKEMTPSVAPDTTTCPECAEVIKAAARKCKHCGSNIDRVVVHPDAMSVADGPDRRSALKELLHQESHAASIAILDTLSRMARHPMAVIALLVACPPLGLWLLWRRPLRWTRDQKLIATTLSSAWLMLVCGYALPLLGRR